MPAEPAPDVPAAGADRVRRERAAALRAQYDAGRSLRSIAAAAGLAPESVRELIGETRPPRRGRSTAEAAAERARLDEMVRTGVLIPPRAPKRPPPVPVEGTGGLSELVIADRG